ncbi:unnamed protein product [Adineta steineri]|uniref:BRCT domain-containing protein n=1 Tax=Adineta steineri TaxID=433720 RepID=A0A813UVV0_9BILA|nr:unnamed protein product [Adineta steineri]
MKSIFLISAHIVNPQWLLICCEKSELMPEIDYLSSADRDEKHDSNVSSMDDKRRNTNSSLSTPSISSLSRQQTGSFNVDQTVLQDDTPRLRRTPGSGVSTPSIIPEYALSPFSLLKRYSNVPRPPVFEESLSDTQIDKISAQLPPTESQMNVDRLMSDLDILMPNFLNQKSSNTILSLASSSRTNKMPSHSFFLAQQAKLISKTEVASSEVKVSWVDDSTEAERIRQYQLHNLDEMTQIHDEY